MTTMQSRRRFVAATAGTMVGAGTLQFFSGLPRVSADDLKPDPTTVQFRPEIEPLVRLLEETPRNRVIGKVADRIRKGTSYREVLTALFLAAVRNVEPRPAVGFKFHAVLVVHSAHLASMSGPASDRWLPILWAIDEFKSSQARDVQEGNWTMAPVDESKVPPAHKAEQAFTDAMDRWDVDAVDPAVASLARNVGANRVFDLFAHYGIRDYRSIGHKAIFVANSWRTLQCIGWQHAEPVLRSLAYALLNHEGEPNPSDSDLEADRPWRRNLELIKSIRGDWINGTPDLETSRILLSDLHDGTPEDGPNVIAEMLSDSVVASPKSIYDGLLLSAGELLMRSPGIIGLHAVTTTNALRYIWATTTNDQTRLLTLLQNAAFLPMFRKSAEGRGRVSNARLLDLQPAEDAAEISLDSIFAEVSGNRNLAAQHVLGHLQDGQSAEDLITRARRLIFAKGSNSHDYKFSSAALEDYYHVAPQLRNRYLATSVFNLRGSGDPDNKLVDRIRAAL